LDAAINLRQCKYLNNIVEQDHRAIKRLTRPMLGFKSWHGARILLAGIETMHMIRKKQLGCRGAVMSAAEFYSPGVLSHDETRACGSLLRQNLFSSL
jgi:putative transposase